MVITTPPTGPTTFYVTTDLDEAEALAAQPHSQLVVLQGSPGAVATLTRHAQLGADEIEARRRKRKAQRQARKRNR